MAKVKSRYVCQACGSVSNRWQGQCPDCAEWNTLVEESAEQVRLRAVRLGLGRAPVRLAAATSVRDILTTVSEGEPPALLVIDSIQTMHSDLMEGAPGTVTQVRASAQELVRFAKEHGTAVVLVGHVTKDGTIAGPRVLEHMVDTVLSFEGERSHQYRILRAMKNRFG